MLWVSGRPGSGKTTVASEVAERLDRQGVAATVLDPGEFVAFIAAGATPSGLQTLIASRTVVLAAQLLSRTGVAVIIDGAVAVGEAIELAREIIESFAVVELTCPADICRARERAVRWGLVAEPSPSRPRSAPSPGLDYAPPRAPDLVVYTDEADCWTTVNEVMELAGRLAGAARTRRMPRA